MISITHDLAAVEKIICDPSVWPWVSDDGCSKSEDFKADDSHMYLLVDDGEMGLFAIRPANSVCCEIHTCLLPSARGRARIYAKEVLAWISENTPFKKVITFIPESNIKAMALAKDSGFFVEGFCHSSFSKNGALIGQHIMGVSLCH